MSNIEQLSLAVNLPDDETFGSYYATKTNVISELTEFVLNKSDPNSFYLFGSQGVGKSHLLHACCVLAEQNGLSSICLSLKESNQYPLSLLEGLEVYDIVCLDDIHEIKHTPEWQRAIFDLYNRVVEQDNKIIIAGADIATKLNFELKDLTSRLQWGATEQLKSLTDEEKITVLRDRARARGIDISVDVAKFLLSRLSRNMKDIINSLNVLDKASIQEQRKITIPFIKETLF